MTRLFSAILLLVAVGVTFIVLADMWYIYQEIARNQAALDRFAREHAASEHRMRELEERITRIKNDRYLIERMAFTEYRLLRSDQHVLYEPLD